MPTTPEVYNDRDMDDSSSQFGAESDASLPTTSDASMTRDSSRAFHAPSIASSSSDMSISVDAEDEIYPRDSVSQRPVNEGSQCDEGPSVVSYHSSFDCLFRELYGRAFSANSENYMLPTDNQEHERQDVQHELLKLDLENSLYASRDQVRSILAEGQSERPAIMDVGTGSGKWALEMALEFPHCDVVGLDISPPTLSNTPGIPDNCRFEVDDANLPLDHYANTFSVVHARCVEMGIIDFESFLYNVAQTVKPGGILLLSSAYAQLFDENYQPLPITIEGAPRFTWIQRLIGEAYTALKLRNNNSMDSKERWDHWLASNPNFENHTIGDRYIPIGPWRSNMTPIEMYISELLRYNFSRVFYSYKPLLLIEGIPEQEVEDMIEATTLELRNLGARAYLKVRYASTTRVWEPWVQMPGPESPPPIDLSISVVTTEEFKALRAQRQAARSQVSSVESESMSGA